MFKKAVFAFFYFFLPIYCFSQNSWTIKKEEDGIAIYTRKAPNSCFKELKAVFYLKTSLSSIVALVDDWENYSNWVYKCGQSSILKKVSDKELIHYQTVLVPWPLDK